MELNVVKQELFLQEVIFCELVTSYALQGQRIFH